MVERRKEQKFQRTELSIDYDAGVIFRGKPANDAWRKQCGSWVCNRQFVFLSNTMALAYSDVLR
jgi:hypothetical protein